MYKQELVFELSPGRWYVYLLITILALSVIWGLVKLSIYLSGNSKYKYRDRRAAIGLGIFLSILSMFIGSAAVTSFEIRYDIVDIATEEIEQYYDYNAGRKLISKDSDKYELFDTDETLGDYIEETFVGKTCEVEYYKISKVIKRITILE